MLLNICIIIVAALAAAALFEKIKLPGLLGMLLLGIAVGPYGMDWLHPTIVEVSKELRQFALIVILLRAGLGLKRDALNQVGASAFKMSFIPGILEGLTVMAVSHLVLGFTFIQGGILGFIIAAVSPAVVVPQMLWLKERGYGEERQVPTMILAGASLDDVFAITIFGTFLAIYTGSNISLWEQFLNIPIGIASGVLIGIVLGFLLQRLFRKIHMRDTKKVLLLLAISVVFSAAESLWTINTLLGIMTIGFILLEKLPSVAGRLAVKMNKVWVFAEILLFVLIGAQVNVKLALDGGLAGLAIIAAGLVLRSVGVIISLMGSKYPWKERLFSVLAYTPKATVQAAIGAVPLAMGVADGEIILALAVLSIVVTAPLGAMAIRLSAPRLLEFKEKA